MQYVVAEDSIDKLQMSVRTTNAIHRIGIHSIEEFLLLSEERLKDVKNVGKKSIQEIFETISILKTGDDDKIFLGDSIDKVGDISTITNVPTFRGKDGKEYYDIPVTELGLSARGVNCLIKEGYAYASKILNLTKNELLLIDNMGNKTANEILNMLESTDFAAAETELNEFEKKIDSYCKQCVLLIHEKLNRVHAGRLYPGLQDFFGEYCSNGNWISESDLIENTNLIEKLYNIDVLHSAVKQQIIFLLESEIYGLSELYLQAKLPDHLENTNIFQDIVDEMFSENIIDYAPNGNIEIKRMSAKEYAQTLKTEKEKELLIGKINGETLEELGNKYEVTRERVRQIIVKILRKKPHLKEDFFAAVFQEYSISREEFTFGFGEPIETYNFLAIAYRVGRREISKLIDDNSYSTYFRKVAEKIVYRNYINVGDERIKCNRPELVDYVIRIFCQEDTDFNSFVELYNMFLEDYGLENDEKLILNNGTYENRLCESYILLWKQWKRFRYYNIEEKDFDELIQTLALEQYQDVEYSTYKFFIEYPELMRSYDIHDEYELHNLLKKIYRNQNNDYIKFKKMPTIEFGTADRDNQVLELLIQYAPISNNELAERYEEEYGVRTETVLANVLKNFDEYFYNGLYSIDAKPLPMAELERMRAVLENDFYTVNDVKRIYLREFPNADVRLVNAYTLKTMGYRVYSGYVIRNTYSSAVAYFREMLTSKDIVDIGKFPKELLSTVAFTTELAKLKRAYEIIEFLPYQYINIRRLNSVEITKKILCQYACEVAEFVGRGEYFTIFSLKNGGFISDLDSLGFDDCFYGSLLAEEHNKFSYRKMGKTKVFVKGNYDISLKSFIIYLLNAEEKIDIYDLVDLLEEKYYVKTDKDKILTLIKDTSLYYNSIMEKVYINYDIYFEEV